MANIYAIKERIKSIESTQKITKTMKLVAASKLYQSKGELENQRSYAQRCRESLGMVLSGAKKLSNPLLCDREVKKVCYVLFVGNRGLCGAYNIDALAQLRTQLSQEGKDYCTVLAGKWGGEHRRDEELKILRFFDDIADVPQQKQCWELADYLEELYLSGEVDRVMLVYQKQQGLGYSCQLQQLLPFHVSERGGGDWIFEPDMETLMDTLANMCIGSTLGLAMIEAKISEHFARMTAMSNATDNAQELLQELRLSLNRSRQARITTEISEIVGGANALNGDLK